MEAFIMDKPPVEHVFIAKDRYYKKRVRDHRKKDKAFMKYINPLNHLIFYLHKEFYKKLDKDPAQARLRMIIAETIELRDKLLVRYRLCDDYMR